MTQNIHVHQNSTALGPHGLPSTSTPRSAGVQMAQLLPQCLPAPRSCASALSLFFLFPIFPQSLSLWPASPSIARKEADIPKFRYSPDLPIIYLPGVCRFQNRDFLREQILENIQLENKKTKPNLKHHILLLPVSGI